MSKKRFQRPDPITNPDSFLRRTDETVFHALQPLDETVRQMEDRWGVDRLETLVSVDTAARFASAKVKLDESIFQNDATEVAKRAAIMQRGWEALDREATERGHTALSITAWTWRDDGGRAHAFVRDVAEAHQYGKENPGVAVWTMAEIIRIVDNFDHFSKNLPSEAKVAFPGAEVSAIKNKGKLDDDIPF
jgi:hypothetical protein